MITPRQSNFQSPPRLAGGLVRTSSVRVSARRGIVFAASLALAASAVAAPAVPANLGHGLDVLVRAQLAQRSTAAARSVSQGAAVAQDPLLDALLLQAGQYLTSAVQKDDGRILISVLLNGDLSLNDVRLALEASGKFEMTASTDSWRQGVLEGWIPLENVPAIALAKGVNAVRLCLKPVYAEKARAAGGTDNYPGVGVGSVTQQGLVQHRADQVRQDGTGITIGVLSDSYNTLSSGTDHALQNVASGDLPGVGNPLGNTMPVVVVQDQAGGTDEGRAMLQVIHDMAPKARLGFGTSGNSQLNMAENIRSLGARPGAPRTVPGFKADIIVDDIIFLDEGMFSDSLIAQAVNDVTGAGIHYFSSAGNQPSSQGYSSDFRLVAPNLGTALVGTNLNFTGVNPALYAGGFHNFRTDGTQDIAQDIRRETGTGTSTANIVFQWDDPFDVIVPGTQTSNQSANHPGGSTVLSFTVPFTAGVPSRLFVVADAGSSFDAIVTLRDPANTVILNQQDTGTDETFFFTPAATGNYTVQVASFASTTGGFSVQTFANSTPGVTTDFNLLFFNKATGAFLGSIASDNVANNGPVEFGSLPFPNDAANYTTIQMVISRAASPNPRATRLRYSLFDSSASASPSEYFASNYSMTYGHSCALDGHGVAAYSPFRPYIPEDFTSPGPMIAVFDAAGNRLANPQVRQKPDLAAMDGANTTFFVGDTSRDPDSFPNFFGTSCAAPNAAACAALVLQAKGGPGALTVRQMKAILQSTTFKHDLDPHFASGSARTTGGKIVLTFSGDNSFAAQEDTAGATVSYFGAGAVASLSINLQNANPKGGNYLGRYPGLVFDRRPRANTNPAVSGGFIFTLGTLIGLSPANITATYPLASQAPSPSTVDHFYQLDLAFSEGTFTGGRSFSFGADRDEQRSAFSPPNGTTRDGGSADLLSDGVEIPSGLVRVGRATFSGTMADGSTFSGVIVNRIGRGYTPLDGFGFINVEDAVNAPVPAP